MKNKGLIIHIGIFLLILLTTGCNNTQENLKIPETPNNHFYAELEIRGVIRSKGAAIKNIRVILNPNDITQHRDTVYTDENGYYKFGFSGSPDSKHIVVFEDIDTKIFVSKTVEVEFKLSDFEKTDDPYKGWVSKTIDIELDKKK